MIINECVICHSSAIKFREIELKKVHRLLPLVICENCGHAIRNDYFSFIDNLTIQKDIFDGNAIVPALNQLKWPRRPKLIANELEKFKGSQGKILDIGCSTGMWLATLGDGWEKYGVELSPVASDIARKFTKANIYNGALETFEAAPNTFDVITAFAVIEHMSDPGYLLSWSFEHLKPGGVLIIMTGDRESYTALEMDANWPLYYSIEHLSFFSSRSLSHLVISAGFQILKIEWRFMYMPWGMGSLFFRLFQKLKEIIGLVEYPQHDHLYLYAHKPL